MANTIYLIRHGQASFMADDYDQLSSLGVAQATSLGAWWESNLPIPDKIAHGTLLRQRQSWEAFRKAGPQQLPPADVMAGLNEHQGTEVLQHHRGDAARPTDKRAALKQFFKMNMRWLAGEIDSGPYESWANFQRRTRATYAGLLGSLSQDQSLALITSGGVIATGIGIALGLNDHKIMELNWQIRNTSISVLHHSRGKLFLRDYNWVPHLAPREITYV